ncbi:MAG TPA: TonB-dependent receptor [Opitutaceae bacterium]|nr:TonB-dependent receptor [Opitutaceae bacterium]
MKRARFSRWFVPVIVAAAGIAVDAQETAIVTLPEFEVTETRVANTAPVGSFGAAVSGLKFEPLVDVQSRNMAEGQADIAVRGGIFENTGFRIGGASLFDPQTGHYFAEIPVAPAMLRPVEVLTGVDNAAAGFNSSVATLQYRWSAIAPRGEATVGAGEYGLRRADIYEAVALHESAGLAVLSDFSASWSQGDGSVPGGDHEFARYAGRLQFRRGNAQTDLFAGYQSKFFGWPNLYTPFGFQETENIKTTLVLLNHRTEEPDGGFLEASALWRRNVDDYEFNRAQPGASNPFEHETRVWAASIEARRAVAEGTFLRGRAEVVADSIDSTSLLFAGFDSRVYFKGSLSAERESAAASGNWSARAGLAFDDDNRGGSEVSPLFQIDYQPHGGATRFYAQVAGASQVPGYTALGSSATGGLFRGNPNLGRERSTNWEVGAETRSGDWSAQAALFLRRDRGLVDWTFRQGVVARTANAVDIDTLGFEAVLVRKWAHARAVLGYAWLEKDADYRGRTVDASFYALNFPRHRATLALIWEPASWIDVRLDNEFRVQEPNFLRVGDDTAFISTVGVHLFPSADRKLEIAILVDNLWDDDFEEVPAVPAARRQAAISATLHW